jgi:hypothetical protein
MGEVGIGFPSTVLNGVIDCNRKMVTKKEVSIAKPRLIFCNVYLHLIINQRKLIVLFKEHATIQLFQNGTILTKHTKPWEKLIRLVIGFSTTNY